VNCPAKTREDGQAQSELRQMIAGWVASIYGEDCGAGQAETARLKSSADGGLVRANRRERGSEGYGGWCLQEKYSSLRGRAVTPGYWWGVLPGSYRFAESTELYSHGEFGDARVEGRGNRFYSGLSRKCWGGVPQDRGGAVAGNSRDGCFGRDQESRESAYSGLPLFLGFSCDRFFDRDARISKTWRRGNDFGYGRLGFREQSGG
jgi:hypothetical protein